MFEAIPMTTKMVTTTTAGALFGSAIFYFALRLRIGQVYGILLEKIGRIEERQDGFRESLNKIDSKLDRILNGRLK